MPPVLSHDKQEKGLAGSLGAVHLGMALHGGLIPIGACQRRLSVRRAASTPAGAATVLDEDDTASPTSSVVAAEGGDKGRHGHAPPTASVPSSGGGCGVGGGCSITTID